MLLDLFLFLLGKGMMMIIAIIIIMMLMGLFQLLLELGNAVTELIVLGLGVTVVGTVAALAAGGAEAATARTPRASDTSVRRWGGGER